MKVTFVAPYALPMSIGGFQTQVYQIFQGLRNLGVDVAWHNFVDSNLDGVDILQVMATDSSMISMMKRARNKGIKVVLTPMQGSRTKSNRYLKTCLCLSKIPQVCTTHKLTYYTINCADHLTPLCSFEANRMTKVYRFDKNRISIIPNGLDQVFFNEEEESVDLPFKDYLLIIGRVEENKNQFTLIEVANKLNMNLLIVGEPGNAGNGYLEKCKRIARDNVYFWGVEKNPKVIKYLYRNANMTVIPSYSEMVPLVAFESLSQKTPVVCTNRCGIAGDEIPGLLFSDIDKDSLIKAIKEEQTYDRKQITNQGIYTWANIAAMYKEVYDKILRNNTDRLNGSSR